MSSKKETDEAVVDRARHIVSAERRIRWIPLFYAVLFLSLSFYFTVKAARKIGTGEEEQLKLGFFYGLALAVVWTTFGLLGAICLGKFLIGVRNATSEFRTQELLVEYHDRLRNHGLLGRSEESSGAGKQDPPDSPEQDRKSSLR